MVQMVQMALTVRKDHKDQQELTVQLGRKDQ